MKLQRNYKRKTLFGLLPNASNGGKFLFGMGPQYLDDDIREAKGVGKPKSGRGPGTYKHKRDIIKASRRRNRG